METGRHSTEFYDFAFRIGSVKPFFTGETIMKTICRPSDHEDANISLYLFADSEKVNIREDMTVIGDDDAPSLMILDCTTANAVVYEGVEEPEDYKGWKYRYTVDGGWVEYEGWATIEQNMKKVLERFQPPNPELSPQ